MILSDSVFHTRKNSRDCRSPRSLQIRHVRLFDENEGLYLPGFPYKATPGILRGLQGERPPHPSLFHRLALDADHARVLPQGQVSPPFQVPINIPTSFDSWKSHLEDMESEDPAQPFIRTSNLQWTFSTVWREVCDLFRLSMPIFVSMVSWVVMKSTDTALLGHVGTKYLEASALSDLWTSSTGVFIQGRVLGMFVGQAVGAGNNPLAGIWLQVSYVVLLAIAIPVILLWALTSTFLQLLGSHKDTSEDAGRYAQILMLCIPVRIAYSQLSQFFQAQRIMYPEVLAALLAMLTNLIGGLIFVLGIPIPHWDGFGFIACPIVTVIAEYFQFAIFFFIAIYWNQLHKTCWPSTGWSTSHLTKERLWTYLNLYIPAALAFGSDYWRFSAIGAIAASLSELELAVFNSSYRILWICLIFTGSLGGAVGIKLGLALGEAKTVEATKITSIGIGLAVSILLLLSAIVCSIPRLLGSIFSSDEEILHEFEKNRFPLAAMMFFMNLAVMLERVPLSMGRTRTVLVLGLVGSWVGQVPAVFLLVSYWQRNLFALYTGVALGYALLCLCLLIVIITSDWDFYAQQAALRSEIVIDPKIQALMDQPVEEDEF